VLQPPLHNFRSLKGDILVIGHWNQQPRNVTLKDYREFQQIVIPVEGEQFLSLGNNGSEDLHDGDIVKSFESREALTAFIFERLEIEFTQLRNREPNVNEMIAIPEKAEGIIGETREDEFTDSEGNDKKIKVYNVRRGINDDDDDDDDDNDWEDVDDNGKVLNKQTKKQKSKS
jgi:hypothetical protein